MARKRTDWMNLGSGKSYAHRVHRPLQCLIFITPLLLFYQIGSVFHGWVGSGAEGESPPPVIAFVLMLKFFRIFGAAGNVLPLAAVVAILMFWHLARKDPWDFEPKLYAGMAGESVLWGIPCFVIGLAMSRLLAKTGVVPSGAGLETIGVLSWQSETILSVGAGVYEELLFRLIAITLLSMILVDAMEMKLSLAVPVIVVVSAVAFSAYHYLGDEPFAGATFAYRAALGVYLAGVYIYRGFGIAVGAHVVYDLLVVSSSHWRHA